MGLMLQIHSLLVLIFSFSIFRSIIHGMADRSKTQICSVSTHDVYFYGIRFRKYKDLIDIS